MVEYMKNKAVAGSFWNQTDYKHILFRYSFFGSESDEEAHLLLALQIPYANHTETGSWIVTCTFMAHWIQTTIT